jgi:hypothetical protein
MMKTTSLDTILLAGRIGLEIISWWCSADIGCVHVMLRFHGHTKKVEQAFSFLL